MGIMGIGAKYDVDDVVGYRPEYSWNYEVGTHLTFPAARLTVDASLLYIDSDFAKQLVTAIFPLPS